MSIVFFCAYCGLNHTNRMFDTECFTFKQKLFLETIKTIFVSAFNSSFQTVAKLTLNIR